jgi:hypothetical protein
MQRPVFCSQTRSCTAAVLGALPVNFIIRKSVAEFRIADTELVTITRVLATELTIEITALLVVVIRLFINLTFPPNVKEAVMELATLLPRSRKLSLMVLSYIVTLPVTLRLPTASSLGPALWYTFKPVLPDGARVADIMNPKSKPVLLLISPPAVTDIRQCL